MNCEEHRRLCGDEDRPIWLLTRAERGAILLHYQSCRECQDWLDAKAASGGEPESEEEEAEELAEGIDLIRQLRLEDETDPEFLENSGKGVDNRFGSR